MLILTVVGMVLSTSAQTSTIKNDIPEVEFLSIEAKGADILKASSYRLTRKFEHFEVRDKPGRIFETSLKEVIRPDKWRTIEEKEYDGKRTKEERLWDGKALYVRKNDGEWDKFSGASSFDSRIESGQITKRYRYLGKVDLSGVSTGLYEIEMLRIANKFSANSMVVVRYLRKTLYWYSVEGKLLKKVEENMIEGREEQNRETTTIEYDPKITIEAPIKMKATGRNATVRERAYNVGRRHAR